jgi:hypothetical protein
MEMRSQINQSAPHGKYGGLCTLKSEVQTFAGCVKGTHVRPQSVTEIFEGGPPIRIHTMQTLPQTPVSTATYASGAPSNTKFT